MRVPARVPAITAAAVAALLAVPGPARAATTTVVATNQPSTRFEPPTVTIDAGDTVVWRTEGTAPHTATADDESFRSPEPILAAYSHTFPSPGTYRYYCRYHGGPGGTGMSGTVIVRARPTTTTTTIRPPTTTSTTAATTTTSTSTTTTTTAPDGEGLETTTSSSTSSTTVPLAAGADDDGGGAGTAIAAVVAAAVALAAGLGAWRLRQRPPPYA